MATHCPHSIMSYQEERQHCIDAGCDDEQVFVTKGGGKCRGRQQLQWGYKCFNWCQRKGQCPVLSFILRTGVQWGRDSDGNSYKGEINASTDVKGKSVPNLVIHLKNWCIIGNGYNCGKLGHDEKEWQKKAIITRTEMVYIQGTVVTTTKTERLWYLYQRNFVYTWWYWWVKLYIHEDSFNDKHYRVYRLRMLSILFNHHLSLVSTWVS